MSNQQLTKQITIQRLMIRTRGLSVHTVKAALAHLGPALQSEVARQPQPQPLTARNIPTLTLAPIPARGDVQQLRQAVASRLVRAISQPPASSSTEPRR